MEILLFFDLASNLVSSKIILYVTQQQMYVILCHAHNL